MNIYNIYENQWEYKFPLQFLVMHGIVIMCECDYELMNMMRFWIGALQEFDPR